jgi:hypothetical protein
VSAQPSGRELRFQGVVVTVPLGWTTAPAPFCGSPANHTVTYGNNMGRAASCPAMLLPNHPPTYLSVSALYGPGYFMSWSGTRRVWHGQPAWTSTQTSGGGLTTVLALPWLNVQIVVGSHDRRGAAELLARVRVHPMAGLGVPAKSSGVEIQTFGDSPRQIAITDQAELARLLADLRALKPVTYASAACARLASALPIVLTVESANGSRTYLVRTGSCDQVTAGTGSAAPLTQRLREDLERLTATHGR